MNNLLLVPFLFLLSLSAFSSEIRVVYVKGDAFVLEDAAQRRLSKGDVLDEGDSIETKKNSFLILDIGQHSKHKIDPETIVQIESLPYKFENGEELEAPVQIYLKVGTIMSDILQRSDNESAIVRTDSTSMGVRGTKFLVSQLDKDVLLSVSEGTVEIQNDNQADIVQANQSIVVENDKVFTAIRPYKFQKKIDWSLKDKNLEPFKKLNASFRSEFLKNKRPWKRDQLRWKQYKEKRQKRLERYKKKTEKLTRNKKLRKKSRVNRRRLLKRRILKEGNSETRTRDAIKKQIIDNSKIDGDVRKKIRKRRRQIRREESKTENVTGTTN